MTLKLKGSANLRN